MHKILKYCNDYARQFYKSKETSFLEQKIFAYTIENDDSEEILMDYHDKKDSKVLHGGRFEFDGLSVYVRSERAVFANKCMRWQLLSSCWRLHTWQRAFLVLYIYYKSYADQNTGEGIGLSKSNKNML